MIILKIGGGATIDLDTVASDLAGHSGKVLVVHGANALRDSLARRLGVEVRRVTSVAGVASTVTDDAGIDLLMMAYAGLANKRLVERLRRHGVDALGLCGLDGGIVRARRNPGIRVREGGRLRLLRDSSGRAEAVDRALLDLLLARGTVPVLTVPLADEHGAAVNSENDDVVAVLARAFRPRLVIHLVEAPGLLAAPDDPGSLIRRLRASELPAYVARAEGRMRRKLMAVAATVDHADVVVIADGRRSSPLRRALAGQGTVIR